MSDGQGGGFGRHPPDGDGAYLQDSSKIAAYAEMGLLFKAEFALQMRRLETTEAARIFRSEWVWECGFRSELVGVIVSVSGSQSQVG